MKKFFCAIVCLCLLSALALPAAAQSAETVIVLGDDGITVDDEPIGEDASAPVYLALEVEVHEHVPEELAGLENRVITIGAAGTYRFSGAATDAQIAVRAGETDAVRIILDGVDITCRTAPAIQGYTALDPREPGEYGLVIELAAGSENTVTGSHTRKINEDDIKHDGAIDSEISLGFEGTGSLTVHADNEGIEVKFGHLTVNGGTFHIYACDDPLNVSEDGVGVLTINDGYFFSSVLPIEGGEGDGIDSNGYIIFNGGTIINLAHPSSEDSGIDSDMGSFINGGIVVGAGNMYDPIEADSAQLFMMLEFGQETDDLVVVTDENDVPVFAYDFPYDYMYIAFSTPDLQEGAYRVYLGGEIDGVEQDGLYTEINSYTPGTLMQHGEGNAQARIEFQMPDMAGMEMDPQMQAQMEAYMAYEEALRAVDLNELLAGVDLNELLAGQDLNLLANAFSVSDLLTQEQLDEHFNGVDLSVAGQFGMGGGPRGMQSSAEIATTDFVLTRSSTGFTNVVAAME